ncbi:hypothetical protein CEXT_345751 [Caerostris extrusa]|uniref:Uncharacterized protein n=1 Tax=Caerostris extrusa TaxID=172846 RepID=A0AAV4QCV4_CAEEX|nr:hypothetical protein CEXT_345751 [Caerostris extrusa]
MLLALKKKSKDSYCSSNYAKCWNIERNKVGKKNPNAVGNIDVYFYEQYLDSLYCDALPYLGPSKLLSRDSLKNLQGNKKHANDYHFPERGKECLDIFSVFECYKRVNFAVNDLVSLSHFLLMSRRKTYSSTNEVFYFVSRSNIMLWGKSKISLKDFGFVLVIS